MLQRFILIASSLFSLLFVPILDYVDTNGSPCPNGKVLITTTLPPNPAVPVKVCGRFILINYSVVYARRT